MIKRSEVDNGDFSTWDFNYNYANSSIFVEKYFAPYLNLTQCKPHNSKKHNHYCFAGSDGVFYIWKYPNKEFGEIGGSHRVCPKYMLNDGRSIAFIVGSGAHYKSVEIIVDVNGQIGQSIVGKDVFSFVLVEMHDYNKPNLPLLTKGFFTGTDAYHGGSIRQPITSLYQLCAGEPFQVHHCGEIIRRNNWKFPKDYPVKF